MSKEDLVKLHALLAEIEAVMEFQKMGGHDMASVLSSVAELQSFVEELVSKMP